MFVQKDESGKSKIGYYVAVAVVSAVGAVVAPVVAEWIRGWKREGVRSARKTKTETDDKLWRIFGPGIDKFADLLDKRDFKAIREEIDRLEEKEKEKSDDSKKPA